MAGPKAPHFWSPSLSLDAAADAVLSAGDEAGGARGEERDHFGDFFRLTEAFDRQEAHNAGAELLDLLAPDAHLRSVVDRRLDRARAHDIDALEA
jgi:hypothetical protein